jgi:hypothetical protein
VDWYQGLGASLSRGPGIARFEFHGLEWCKPAGDYLFDDALPDAPNIFEDGFESDSGNGAVE